MTVYYDDSVKKYTWIKIGGVFKEVYLPTSYRDVQDYVHRKNQKKEEVYIVGCGSNSLFQDGYINASLIRMTALRSCMIVLDEHDGVVYCDSGFLCRELANFSCKNELSGLEFLTGIPGSVGGILYMNAGCCGCQTYDNVLSVKVMNRYSCRIENIKKADIFFGYRVTSFFLNDYIILGGFFRLCRKDKDSIKAKMSEVKLHKTREQPVGIRTLGSTFKNVYRKGNFYCSAWKILTLLPASNLKCYPNISFSHKHLNFLVNEGEACFYDVYNFLKNIQRKIYTINGLFLEREIRFIPYRISQVAL